jgi:hypothetical protein
VSPGFLAHLIYASDLKRQTIFMSLGEVHARQAVAVRLRHVVNPDEFTILDPLAHTARALVVSKPRQIIQALFGAVPDGLLGALARLGPQPLSDPSLYRELFGLFAHPMHRARANLLKQASGKLTETKVRIALVLDPVLLAQHVFDNLIFTNEVEQLHAALALMRQTVSTATDEALRNSVRDLPVKPDMDAWVQRWLEKLDRPLVRAPLEGDPDFAPLYGPALERAADRFANCLSRRKLHAAAGRHAYFEYLPSPGAIVELTRLSNDTWVVTDISGRRNGKLPAHALAVITSKLERYSIPSIASAMPSGTVRLIARLLNVFDLMTGNTLGDDPEEGDPVIEELAA